MGIRSSCLNALYSNCVCLCVCLCVSVCMRACKCVCVCLYMYVCGVWCHQWGCVVVDSRLHTPGESVITQANAHTHCKLVESVVPLSSLSLFLSFVLHLSLSLFLSSKLFLCDSQCGPGSGLAMRSVSCVLECVGASSQFHPHAHASLATRTHTHTHTHACARTHTITLSYTQTQRYHNVLACLTNLK